MQPLANLWGDVPALMPMTEKAIKVATMGAGWPPGHPKHVPGLAFNGHAERAFKNTGGLWFAVAHNTTSGHGRNPVAELTERGVKGFTPNGEPLGKNTLGIHGSRSKARKAASAHIAKIPLELARHIARAWHPDLVSDREATA